MEVRWMMDDGEETAGVTRLMDWDVNVRIP